MLMPVRQVRTCVALFTFLIPGFLIGCGDSDGPTGPSATPYSDHIVYVGAGGITIIKSDGTGKAVVVSDHADSLLAPTWSPDKTAIAYLRKLATGETQIRVFRDGQSPAVLATGMIEDTPWSPDATRIAFWRSDTIFVVNAAGGQPVMLLSAAREPCFLNNFTIVFRYLAGGVGSDRNGAIYRIPAVGGVPTKVSPYPDGFWIYRPRVSHSGDSIAFVQFQEGGGFPPSRWNDVFIMDTVGNAVNLGRIGVSSTTLDLLAELDYSYDDTRLIAVTEHPVINDPYEIIIGVPVVNRITGAACDTDIRSIDYAPDSYDFVFAREGGGIAIYGRSPRVTRVLDPVGKHPDW